MSKRICSKKFFVICFVFCFVSLLFAQTKEDIIARIPNAENLQPWELSKVMPDWSEYFSIDDDFDVTDLAKIRWVDYGEGNYEWREYETISFDFNIIPRYRNYKHGEITTTTGFNGEEFNYTKAKFSFTGEYVQGYFCKYLNPSDNYDDLLKELPGKQINKVWISKYSRKDGRTIDYSDLSGTYFYQSDIAYLSIVPDYDYAGTVSISDNNEGLQEEGLHLFTYDPIKHEIRTDGIVGSIYNNNGYYLGSDDIIIKILSFNKKAKLLLLVTPKYTRPFVPMEDYFVENDSKLYRRLLSVTMYEQPDFSSEKKVLTERDYFIVLDDSRPMEENNGHISKWVYVKAEKSGIEGWVWGYELETSEFSATDGLIEERYARYNTSKLINKPATFNDTRVRCRTQPNLDCDTQGFYNLGDKVTVLYKSLDPTEIDGESWYWYLVRSDSLPDGWVYGKYLDIEE